MKPICQLLWALLGLVLCSVLFVNDWIGKGSWSLDRACNRGLERVRRGVA